MSDSVLLPGITQRILGTSRLRTGLLERHGDDPGTPPERTVVLVHGNVSSALFWQQTMLDLPSDLRVIAADLRGFGSSEHLPIDATRGVRDFSDDLGPQRSKPWGFRLRTSWAGRWAGASSCSTPSITPR